MVVFLAQTVFVGELNGNRVTYGSKKEGTKERQRIGSMIISILPVVVGGM